MLQSLSGGVKEVEVEGRNVRRVIDRLEELYPGMKARLVEEGAIRPNLAVAIDGEVARMGLLEKVGEDSEVHFGPGHRWRSISTASPTTVTSGGYGLAQYALFTERCI